MKETGMLPPIEYAYTSLVVEDVQRATAFYTRAFGFDLDHAHDDWDYAAVRTGPTRIAFVAPSLAMQHVPIPLRLNRAAEEAAGVELTFVTDDVDRAFGRAVEAGATIVVPPTEKPWGRTAYLRDPDGVLIQLAAR
jgi:lactoylglutathione lyase